MEADLARGRRRAHRPVDRAAGRRGGQVGRAARGRAARVRRLRPQRRLLRRLAHARPRQRDGALAGRDGDARAAGPREPRGDRGDDRAPRDRLRLGADRDDRRRHRAAPAAVAGGGGARRCAASAGRRSCSTADGVRARRGLADLRRRPAPARRLRARRPGAAVLGARATPPSRRARRFTRARPCPSLATDGDGVRAVCPGGAVRARRVLLATAAFPPLVRAIRRYVVPVYDYVLVTEPLERGAARRDRLARPRGALRRHQPVPLLPPDRRPPDPLGRLRRGLRLRRPRLARARRPARDLRACSRSTSARRSRSSGGIGFSAPLGRRDRHLQPLQRAVGEGARRPRGLRRRLHRAGRRRLALRRARGPRPARRARHGAHAARDGAAPADPVPARARALGGHHAHAPRARARGPPRGPARPVAATLDRLGLGFDS